MIAIEFSGPQNNRNAFDAAIAAGVKRIVFLSNYGAGEFGDDEWRFQARLANERRHASLGVDWTILRPTRFMNYTPYVWGSVFQRNLLLEGGGERNLPDILSRAA